MSRDGLGSSDVGRMRRAANSPTLPAFQAMAQLNDQERHVLEILGNGGKLRCPHPCDGTLPAELIPYNPPHADVPPQHKPWGPHEQIDLIVVNALFGKGLIHKLTRDGEPPPGPERRYRANPGKRGKPLYLESYRAGWLELGLNGETADWYVCMM